MKKSLRDILYNDRNCKPVDFLGKRVTIDGTVTEPQHEPFAATIVGALNMSYRVFALPDVPIRQGNWHNYILSHLSMNGLDSKISKQVVWWSPTATTHDRDKTDLIYVRFRLVFFEDGIAAAAEKSSEYPHLCPVPGCGAPAYVGFKEVACSSSTCSRRDPRR